MKKTKNNSVDNYVLDNDMLVDVNTNNTISHQTDNDIEQNKQKNTQKDKFVVLRNGFRVSNDEHLTYKLACDEMQHWKNIIQKWPDGSRLEITNLTTT